MFLGHDGLGETRLRAIDGRFDDGHQRFGRMPQGLVKSAQELGLEAGGEGRARLVQYLANAAQAQSMHEALGFLAKAERGERQGMQDAPLLTRGNGGAILLAVMSNCPSGPCRVGNRHARDEPKGLEASGKIG